MLDDYKYSIGRLVVYRHSDPRLPKQSYGHHGPQKTVGEVIAVDMDPAPSPHWVYTLANIRNQEVIRVAEDGIEFGTEVGKRGKRMSNRLAEKKLEDGALAEIIAKALVNPAREGLLHSTLRDLIQKEELSAKAAHEGTNLPVHTGDYIRVRGDLRSELEELHNHYAKITKVEDADVAGLENPDARPGMPTIYRTVKKYEIITSEGVKATIYDPEIKIFYTAQGRKLVLNWRAATLLAEAFGDQPPYKLEFEYLADHVFTREELESKKRAELVQMLASLLYVKGKLGWREFQRRNHYFAGTPKIHLVDTILEMSRFDSRRNRPMTRDEIVKHCQQGYKLRRLLKSS